MNFREVIKEGWFTLTVKQRVVATLVGLLMIAVLIWVLICRCG